MREQFVDMLEAVQRPQVARLHARINALNAALATATARAAALEGALDHIQTITAPEMEPLYAAQGIRPHNCAGVSAHKIAKCALLADRPAGAEGEG